MGLAQGCNEVHEQKKLPMIRLQKEGEETQQQSLPCHCQHVRARQQGGQRDSSICSVENFFFSRSMVFCISMHDARVRERLGRNYHGAETSELQ